jgi:hypothetical protein
MSPDDGIAGFDHLSRLDVSKPRLRPSRYDPKRYDTVKLTCRRRSAIKCYLELADVCYNVVRRDDDHHGIIIKPPPQQHCCQQDAGGSVPTEGFNQDVVRREQRQLVADQLDHVLRGNHKDPLSRHEGHQPHDGVLNERSVTGNVRELLWTFLGASRPQVQANASGHNKGDRLHTSSGCYRNMKLHRAIIRPTTTLRDIILVSLQSLFANAGHIP